MGGKLFIISFIPENTFRTSVVLFCVTQKTVDYNKIQIIWKSVERSYKTLGYNIPEILADFQSDLTKI